MALIVSKIALAAGLLSFTFMCFALFSPSPWAKCQETRVFNHNESKTLSFNIEVFNICPVNSPTDASDKDSLSKLDCRSWTSDEVKFLKDFATLKYISRLIFKMRSFQLTECIGVLLLGAGTLFTVHGYVRNNNSMLFGAFLFLIAGSLIAFAILIFISGIVMVRTIAINAENTVSASYELGLGFYYALAGVIATAVGFVFCFLTFVYEYNEVEVQPAVARNANENLNNIPQEVSFDLNADGIIERGTFIELHENEGAHSTLADYERCSAHRDSLHNPARLRMQNPPSSSDDDDFMQVTCV